jgi:DNA-directed RNA polymerase specialized sigma24 family protein
VVRCAARRLGCDAWDAGDVCQAVFMALVLRPGPARRAAHLGSWLHELTLAAARQMAAEAPGEPASPLGARAAGGALPAGFDRALARLSSRRRAAVIDLHLRGLGVGEAARALGLAPERLAGVETAALAGLRRMLPGDGAGNGGAGHDLAAVLAAERGPALADAEVQALTAAAMGGARASVRALAASAVLAVLRRRLARLVLPAVAAGLLVSAAAAAALLLAAG